MCCINGNKEPRFADPSVMDALDYLVRMYNSIHTGDKANTAAGHWINEAFVVRLWAILEAYHVVNFSKSIDESLGNSDMVKSCRWLRHEIAHSTAEINDADSRRLDMKLRKVFSLGDQPSIIEGKFILSKDTVLRPMAEGCLNYCRALLDQERDNSSAVDIINT